jgi:hypothetical protein
MKRVAFLTLAAGLVVCMVVSENFAQRGGGRGGGGGGGRGGGGGYGGGARPGGFTAPAARPAPQARPSAPARPATAGTPAPQPSRGSSGVGPGGGSWQSGSGGGSYTTKGGSTINYGGGAVGGTTGGGVTGGKYVGGVQVTTPGGQTINKVGSGGAATGPGGVTAGSKGSITGTNGPAGSGVAASRGAAAVGPGGAVGGKAGVAVGPGGAAAGRTGAATSSRGTYYRSAGAVKGQGAYVRAGVAVNGNSFSRAWVGRYPGTWFPGKWAAVTAWTAVAWGAVSSSCGYPEESTSYDYGSSVVYQDNAVYVNGDNVGTPEEYAQQATAIADAGKQAKAPADDEWMSLGVFAMVQGEETTSNNIFQLAVNKAGVIRGNYYNALTDTALPVVGAVDPKTQRAAWTVGDKKTPVYEAGIINLTKDDTTMMVHYGKEKSQQFTLFRIEKPENGTEPAPAPAKEGQ